VKGKEDFGMFQISQKITLHCGRMEGMEEWKMSHCHPSFHSSDLPTPKGCKEISETCPLITPEI